MDVHDLVKQWVVLLDTYDSHAESCYAVVVQLVLEQGYVIVKEDLVGCRR
jgi:hypothetical protein